MVHDRILNVSGTSVAPPAGGNVGTSVAANTLGGAIPTSGESVLPNRWAPGILVASSGLHAP